MALSRFHCWVAAAIMALGSGKSSAQTDFPTVKAEVSGAWERLRAVSRSVQVEGEQKTIDRLASDRLVSHVKLRRRINEHSYLMESEILASSSKSKNKEGGTSTSSSATGFNTRYAFSLKSTEGGRDWRLVLLRMTDSMEPTPRQLDLNYHLRYAPVFEPYQNEVFTPLPDLFAHPTFKLISCGPSPSNSGCVRVLYEARTTPDHPEHLSSGWLDLNPISAWSIQEADEKMVDKSTTIATHIRITVDLKTGNIPLIREKVVDVRQETGGKVRVSRNLVYTYNCQIEKNVPETEFTLSAYGLPEPQGVSFSKPTPRYAWLLAAAGGSAALAVGLRFLARRRTATLSQST